MSALNELQFQKAQDLGIGLDWLRSLIGKEFWQWYRNHSNDKILTKGVFIFKVTIRVKDVHWLFETLFGEEPVAEVLTP